ncbi:hypothetical protein K438DRAFT_1805841 [Mycena galopus ATCC 62051]|nr:hypothetical protein K438DRAFT_1805841 [Mycena galopus ATCC 62051]
MVGRRRDFKQDASLRMLTCVACSNETPDQSWDAYRGSWCGPVPSSDPSLPPNCIKCCPSVGHIMAAQTPTVRMRSPVIQFAAVSSIVLDLKRAAAPPLKPLGSSEQSSVQVGPIAGGIIAALVLLGLIGVGIWWYLRRRRRRHHMAPSAAYRAALRAGNVSPQSYQPVHNDSDALENSTDAFDTQIPFPQTEDSPVDRHSSWLQSRPISIHSESRFREHTTT